MGSRLVAWLSAASKALVLLSLAVAIGVETWLGRWAYLPLTAIVPAAALAGLIAGRLAPGPAVCSVLLFTYTAPAVFALALGMFRLEMLLTWSAALTGLLLADPDRLRWSYPPGWRFPLILWSVTVAVTWPLIALRELDFAPLDLLARYRVPNTGLGGAPTGMAAWTMDVAIVHLLGLVWFDWLFRRTDPTASPTAFERRVARPLAVSAVAGSLLALYQGLADITFLSGGLWPSVGRAPGSLMDANAFGMVAALWTAGLAALASPGWRLVWLAGSVICWGGLWMTGSRTALLAAGAAAAAGLAAVLSARVGRTRIRLAAVATATVLLGGLAVIAFAPPESQSPAARLRWSLPSDTSAAGLRAFAIELWNRNGYGLAATALARERPIAGHGLGTFNMFGADYLRRSGTPLPPDNAQNWWRHQIVELGVLGAAGPLLWTIMFLVYLARSRSVTASRLPAALLKGALVGFGLASLVGMPAQSLPVTITFWTFAFWLTCHTGPARVAAEHPMSAAAWGALAVLVLAHASLTFALGRGDLRPAVRAARGDWRYAYGVYAPPGEDRIRRTERRGVAVVPVEGTWMVLHVSAGHPDIEQRPVHAVVRVNGRTVADLRLHTHAPLTRAVHVGPAPRAVIDARVDRAWRTGTPDAPEIGLELSWTFADAPPPGLPGVSAPGPR